MPSQEITLAYHHENQLFAQQLEKCFAKTNVAFQHLICREGNNSPTYNQVLQKEKGKILLIVSDNYLRSVAAMENGLPTIQNLVNTDKVVPFVIDGVDQDNKIIPTEFERIGQIIKYMNYWQDSYLNLRQEGRQRGEIDDELESQTKKVREISTNIGEYLRYLRDLKPATLTPITNDQFASFKNFFGITGEVDTRFLDNYISLSNEKSNGVSNGTLPSAQESSDPLSQQKEIAKSLNEELEEVVDGPIAKDQLSKQLENAINDETDITDEIGGIEINIDDIPGMDQIIAANKANATITSDDLTTDNIASDKESKLQDELRDLKENEEIKLDDFAPSHDEVETKKEVPVKKESTKRKFSIPGYLDDLSSMTPAPTVEVNIEEELESIQAYISAKNFSEAKDKLDLLSEDFPRDARVWQSLGSIAENQADYILAYSHYNRALELDASLPDLDYKVGLIASNYYPDQVEKALHFFNAAIIKKPSNVDAQYQKGIILNEKKGLHQEAISVFKNVLILQPDHEFANYDLALIYYDQKKSDKALSYYKKAFANNPELKTSENDVAFGLKKQKSKKKNKKKASAPSEKKGFALEQTPEIDQTVFITGATSGIGKATARKFAQAGYRVILSGRRTDLLESYAEELSERNPNIQYLTFDVRDVISAQTELNKLEGKFAEIDLLINNAGLASGFDPIHEGDLNDWNKMIDTNIKGLLYMTRLITPHMVEKESGHVINVCSTAGHEVYPKGNVYCATKYAVDALTKGMRLDLHKFGIKVSQVSPAHVEETEFAKVRFHGDVEKAKIYNEFNPLKSSDVANTIFFIATQPAHVNIQDVLLMGTQQASSLVVDKSGRKYD